MAPLQLSSHSCHHCRKFVILEERLIRAVKNKQGEDWHTGRMFRVKLSYLISARDDGCLLCSLIIEHLRSKHKLLFESKSPEASRTGEGKVDNFPLKEKIGLQFCYHTLNILILLRTQIKAPWQMVAMFTCLTPSSNLASFYFRNRPPETEPLAPETVHRLRKWLHDCHENHPECVKSQNSFPDLSPARPKRLIEITTIENQRPYLRLIQVSESQPLSHYAALSYCWGQDPHGILKCLSSMLSSLSINILWEELPKTIQDAISVCQILDMRLLWVDAICIVQDDETEKEVEIAKMGGIYGAAFFTILASRASAAQEGFLHRRTFDLQEMPWYTLPLESQGGLAGSVTLVQYFPHADSKPTGGPLYRRGWAFQERLLSSRTISFHEGHTAWRCAVAEGSDGWQSKPATIYEQLSRLRKSANGPSFAPRTDPYMKSRQYLDWWLTAVEFYSGLAFTVSKDRGLAISAIAEEINLILHDEYLAGIWKSSFPYGFLWNVKTRHSTTINPDPTLYQGPSWSWMSVNKGIHYRRKHDFDPSRKTQPYDAELLDAVCTPVEISAPYGSFRQHGTYINVRGHLLQGLVPVDGEGRPDFCSSNELGFLNVSGIYLDYKLWKDVTNQPLAKYTKVPRREYPRGKSEMEPEEDVLTVWGKETTIQGEDDQVREADDEKDEGRCGDVDDFDQFADWSEDGHGMSSKTVHDQWLVPVAILIMTFDDSIGGFINGLILRPNSDGTYRRVGYLGISGVPVAETDDRERWDMVRDMVPKAERKEVRII